MRTLTLVAAALLFTFPAFAQNEPPAAPPQRPSAAAGDRPVPPKAEDDPVRPTTGRRDEAGEPEKPAAGGGGKKENKAVTAETANSPLDFIVKDGAGEDVPMARYKGKALLIVNVASKCGYTPQYEGLEALYKKYGERGLAIAAFPSNDFGGQEPGTNAEIKEFCQRKYGVTFDVLGKVPVKGEQACELYKYLTSRNQHGSLGGEIKWNFTKFLVDRDGKVIARFEPADKPDSEKVMKAIEKALDERRGEQPDRKEERKGSSS